MNEEKRISIIIPIYNSERYLTECLDSVVNQTYRNLEIILVNDGSTDRSPEICRSYTQKDERIVFISQENAGGAVARNTGLRAARGEIVMFVDSDDMLTLDICEQVCREMQDYDLMIMNHQVFYSTEEIKDRLSGPTAHTQDLCDYSRENRVCFLLGPKKTDPTVLNLNTVWGKAYKRQFVEDYDIVFPVKILMGEDLLFNLLVFLKGLRVCRFPVKAYFYRYNHSSIVHKHIAAYSQRDAAFQERLKCILAGEGLQDQFTEELGYQELLGLLQTFSSDIFHRNNPKPEREKKADFLALVSRKEYRALIPAQLKHFPPEKRLALLFAVHRLYLPLKGMYFLNDRRNDLKKRRG